MGKRRLRADRAPPGRIGRRPAHVTAPPRPRHQCDHHARCCRHGPEHRQSRAVRHRPPHGPPARGGRWSRTGVAQPVSSSSPRSPPPEPPAREPTAGPRSVPHTSGVPRAYLSTRLSWRTPGAPHAGEGPGVEGYAGAEEARSGTCSRHDAAAESRRRSQPPAGGKRRLQLRWETILSRTRHVDGHPLAAEAGPARTATVHHAGHGVPPRPDTLRRAPVLRRAPGQANAVAAPTVPRPRDTTGRRKR
ncbi:hypothetical protein JOF36_007495 [Pseudonocardia parietis]|uniref:Uncharacterized protein n=1 Tax=Pseudonocardia parietis TaxID=570936 RepID=A0ABS4W681_9PSEU|nr:hypothetical protein [Pseudonocardia parietis]